MQNHCFVTSAIKGKHKGDIFTHPQRRSVAAKLAINLLMFCAWRHTSRSWDREVISFAGNSVEDYDKSISYITCILGHDGSKELEPDEEDAPIQCFTKFAKLLLEIEYGSMPDGDFSPRTDFGWKGIRDFHRDKSSYDDESRQKYLDAVDACLRFDKLYRTARATASGKLETQDETYRKLVQTKILSNIVADLPRFRNLPKKRTRESPVYYSSDDTGSDSEGGFDLDIPTIVETEGNPDSGRWKAPKARKKARYSSNRNTIIYVHRTLPRLPTAGYADLDIEEPRIRTGSAGTHSINGIHPDTARFASQWFSKLATEVQPVLESKRRTGDPLVKVAVFDTGIDQGHKTIKKHLEANGSMLQTCKDWTASPSGIVDNVGHGTAVCDVLLQVAKVELYVGKVLDAAVPDSETPGRIAEAILHASDPEEWDVDIIVLCAGFEQEEETLRRAILKAFERDKLIFVAASNSGSLELDQRVSYPARIHGQVLSIRSTIGSGRRADASPSRSAGDHNFAILGEGVEAAWPAALNNGQPTKFISGTSFATPLAAAIAALTMEFAVQKGKKGPNLSTEMLAKLKTYRGMTKLFLYMSSVSDQDGDIDCRVVYPWRLFDSQRTPDFIAGLIQDELRKL